MQMRKLEWEGVGARIDAAAFGIRVFYRIDGQPGQWTMTCPGPVTYVDTEGFETQRAAQAAAKADFERRIAAELQPSI